MEKRIIYIQIFESRFWKLENLGYHINRIENLLGLIVTILWNKTFVSGKEQLTTDAPYFFYNLEDPNILLDNSLI